MIRVYRHQFESNEDGPEEWGILIFFRSLPSEAVRPKEWLEGVYEFSL
jgi:hypothetical protein